MGAVASSGVTETRTIDRITEAERHGSPANQFTLWFGANLQITAVVDGALVRQVEGGCRRSIRQHGRCRGSGKVTPRG